MSIIRAFLLFYLTLTTTLSAAQSSNPNFIILPYQHYENNDRFDYAVELISHAIKQLPLDQQYRIEISKSPIPSWRIPTALSSQSSSIDIGWLPCSSKNDQAFLKLPIPMYMGTLGARIFITTPRTQKKIAKGLNLAGLKKFTIAVGRDWEDKKIMENAGLTLLPVSNHSELYEALKNGKADLVTRSMYEAYTDIASLNQKYPNFIVEKNIMLNYPQCMYLYASTSSKQKLNRIFTSFKRLADSGHFKKVFQRRFKEDLDRSKSQKRTVIKIGNNNVSNDSNRSNKDLWHQF